MNEDLKRQAENFEDEGRIAKREKRYEDAILSFEKAKQHYEQLGHPGQIGIITKEIKRIQSLMQFLGEQPSSKTSLNIKESGNASEKNTKRDLEKEANAIENRLKMLIFKKEYDIIIENYTELAKIYEKLNYEFQLRKTRFEIEKYQNLKIRQEMIEQEKKNWQNGQKKTIAEERAERLQNQKRIRTAEEERNKMVLEEELKERDARKQVRLLNIDDKIQQAKQERLNVFHSSNNSIEINNYQKQQLERDLKLKKLKEKQQQEERILEEANQFLDIAKENLENNQYDIAADYYNKAGIKFQEAGWIQQASVLQKEVQNMAILKKKYEVKLQEEAERKQKQQEEFDARAAKILADKEEKKRREEEERRKLSPEMQAKVDRSRMILEKAESLESKEKYEKALSRYEYLIELYKEIGYEDNRIQPILIKIENLKNIINSP